MTEQKCVRPVHAGCGGEVTELWNDLVEYRTCIGAGGELEVGDQVTIIDGGSREGYFCNKCDEYIDVSEVVAPGAKGADRDD